MKKQAKHLLAISLLMLTTSSAVFADRTMDASSMGYCEIVFYCQTTKILNLSPDGTVNSLPNGGFRFALKGDKFLVPESALLLGGGSTNWKPLRPFCEKENPKDLNFLNVFEAESWIGDRLQFKDGVLKFSNMSSQDGIRVWLATCDRFD